MRRTALCRATSAVLLSLVCLGNSATMRAQLAPSEPPREYSRSELETEQRIIRAHIKDAEFNISRGINAVGADLADSAKVSVLRGAGRIAQAEGILKEHLVRIERLAFSLFYRRENERRKLRVEHEKIRTEFVGAEDSLYALQRDMVRKGIFGEDLKRQIAVLDAVPKVIDELQGKDPAKAAQVRSLVDEINQALSNGDVNRATELIRQLHDLLSSAGYGPQIEQGMQKIEQQVAAAERESPVAKPAAPAPGVTADRAGPREVSRRTLPNGAEEVVTEQVKTNPDGSKSVTRTVTTTNPDGSKDVTTIVESYDPQGRLIGRTADTKKYDAAGNLISESSAEIQGDRLIIRDGKGGQHVVPMSFFRGGDAAPIYETRYIGGEGQTLTAEREITIKLKMGPGGEFLGVDQTPGRERTWDFAIEEVEGARSYGDDRSMTTKLAFSDRKLKTDYKLTGWVITNPAGQEVARFGAEKEITAKLTESGVHRLSVTGETDWGSPFNVSVELTVAL